MVVVLVVVVVVVVLTHFSQHRSMEVTLVQLVVATLLLFLMLLLLPLHCRTPPALPLPPSLHRLSPPSPLWSFSTWTCCTPFSRFVF
jgi:hypothetical protein